MSRDSPEGRIATKNRPMHPPVRRPLPNLDGNRHLSAKFQGWPTQGLREGPRYRGAYNDQTFNRPRAVFLHVCVRHWDRDRCRKLAHLKRGTSAGRLYAGRDQADAKLYTT
jgi:hypothetical protein